MRWAPPIRSTITPSTNAPPMMVHATHGRQRRVRAARGNALACSPIRSRARRARRARKVAESACSPTTSAAARLAQARSASVQTTFAGSRISRARMAEISRAATSSIVIANSTRVRRADRPTCGHSSVTRRTRMGWRRVFLPPIGRFRPILPRRLPAMRTVQSISGSPPRINACIVCHCHRGQRRVVVVPQILATSNSMAGTAIGQIRLGHRFDARTALASARTSGSVAPRNGAAARP